MSGKKAFRQILKVLILLGAAYLLFNRLDVSAFRQMQVSASTGDWLLTALVFFALFSINLSLDALNWQKVQSIVRPIGWTEALMHNLKSYALAFVTPVNSGELAGRYLVQKEGKHRQKTLFLTFWTHAPKLFSKISIAFPLLIWLLKEQLSTGLQLLLFIALGLSLVFYFNLEKVISALNQYQIKRFELKNYLVKGRPLLTEKLALLLINALRFLCFSGQLAAVIWLFKPSALNLAVLASIPVFYFLTAVIPTWAAFDFLVKAALSLYFFQFVSSDEEIFLIASSVVWLFNIGLPALIGLVKFDLRELKKFKRRKG